MRLRWQCSGCRRGGDPGPGVKDDYQILNEYFRIPTCNPVTHKQVGPTGRFFGKTSVSRRVNDADAAHAVHFKTITTDSRAKRLDGKGITNKIGRAHV